jgi:hypothetical protein
MAIDADKLVTITKAMAKAAEVINILLDKRTTTEVSLGTNEFYIKINGVDIWNHYLNNICRDILNKNFAIDLLDVFFEAIDILHNEMNQLLSSAKTEDISDISFFIDGEEVDINRNRLSTTHNQEK